MLLNRRRHSLISSYSSSSSSPYSSSSTGSSPYSSSSNCPSSSTLYPFGMGASGMFPARTALLSSLVLCQLRTTFQLCATNTKSRHFSGPRRLRRAVCTDSHTAHPRSQLDADTGCVSTRHASSASSGWSVPCQVHQSSILRLPSFTFCRCIIASGLPKEPLSFRNAVTPSCSTTTALFSFASLRSMVMVLLYRPMNSLNRSVHSLSGPKILATWLAGLRIRPTACSGQAMLTSHRCWMISPIPSLSSGASCKSSFFNRSVTSTSMQSANMAPKSLTNMTFACGLPHRSVIMSEATVTPCLSQFCLSASRARSMRVRHSFNPAPPMYVRLGGTYVVPARATACTASTKSGWSA
ncbi:hypothetical protein CLOP_g14061 [Closterium sp. NIES-67]|nr:hypothetical protein CLOP_g14061 [Closterium sp. NIES-67]